MNFKDLIRSIIRPHEEDVLSPLTTTWGEQLNPSDVLSKYPRPQLWRPGSINLNGIWHYAITSDDTCPDHFQAKILVPFSPEAALSVVDKTASGNNQPKILQPEETLWYQTYFEPDMHMYSAGRRLLLHFGAVDYEANLFINDSSILIHQGGYLPFTADITDYITEGKNILTLKVKDGTDTTGQARGKQTLHRGGIFYTAQSGIWQTVWMEWVSDTYMENLWFETDYDTRNVTVHVAIRNLKEETKFTLEVFDDDTSIIAKTYPVSPASHSQPSASSMQTGNTFYNTRTFAFNFTIPIDYFHSWSPEDPFLYQVQISLGEDTVKSYFAMRLFTLEKQGKIPVFCLNHKPYFLMGVLDQGYWPDGLYTAPSDEALIHDITTMKKLGFNMLRKHLKVETARWYYHCDRLGMIVCQDMVNGGDAYSMPLVSYFPTLFPGLAKHFKDSHYKALSRTKSSMRTQWEIECQKTIEHLRFFPSIAIWCLFNEGWGQFDAARITAWIRKADPSRLIDSASGWFDQGCGDFISVHNYFRPLSVPVKKWAQRGFFLSEYGGYACHIKKHSSLERIYGYKRFDSPNAFTAAYQKLIEESLLPLKKQGLSGAVYTQLSDIEEEANGILTYDRKIIKLEW